MKKLLIVFVMTLSMLNFATLSSAERYYKSGGTVYRVIVGQVVSIDKTKNQFTIKDDDNGKETTIKAWASDIAKLTDSTHVKVTLPQFGNLAVDINS